MALKTLLTISFLVILFFSSCTIFESDKLNNNQSTLEKLIELNNNSKEVKPIINITKEIVEYIQYPLIEVRSNGIIRQVLMIPLFNSKSSKVFYIGFWTIINYFRQSCN